MTIEKRFHQRMDIEAEVDINIVHRDRHITAQAKNITPYGMLLSTGKLSVPTGMLLELSVNIDGYFDTVPALIIWSSQKKIGVMFPQIQAKLFTAAESLGNKYTQRKQKSAKDSTAPRTASKHMLFQPEPHSHI